MLLNYGGINEIVSDCQNYFQSVNARFIGIHDL